MIRLDAAIKVLSQVATMDAAVCRGKYVALNDA
jgi:hypothetical protein